MYLLPWVCARPSKAEVLTWRITCIIWAKYVQNMWYRGKRDKWPETRICNSWQQDLVLLRECLIHSYTLNTVLWCVGKHWEHWEFFPLPAQSLGKLAEETHSNAREIRPKALSGVPFAKRKRQRPSEVWLACGHLHHFSNRRTVGHAAN